MMCMVFRNVLWSATIAACLAITFSTGCKSETHDIGAEATPKTSRTSISAFVHRISIEGIHEELGVIEVAPHKDGILIKTDLEGLKPGKHAFHIHQNPDCRSGSKDGVKIAGLAAGGHYGSQDQKEEAKGNLPDLIVDKEGINSTEFTHNLTIDEIADRSVMIHEKSHDEGSGARIACGVLE